MLALRIYGSDPKIFSLEHPHDDTSENCPPQTDDARSFSLGSIWLNARSEDHGTQAELTIAKTPERDAVTLLAISFVGTADL